MRVLIVGCGYVGLPLGAELVRQGHEVFGLRRSAAAELQSAGLTPLVADITRPDSLAKLPRAFDAVVNCVASGGGGAEEYRELYFRGTENLIAWLGADGAAIPQFIYTSSTGVYGQNDGSLVEESSVTVPESATAKILVETEQLLLERAQERKFSAVILRAAGIYGPGRGYLLKQFLRGEARIEGVGGRWLNMIHRDDLMGVIGAVLAQRPASGVFNVVDDEPVSQLDFYSWLAAELKQPLPPNAPAEVEASRKRGVTNKRISNELLKARLGYRFGFPTFREGYGAELRRLGR